MTEKEELLSSNEAELYDRQIRLWGLDAQKRLRAARVAIVGMGGLGAEVAKNIILAGVKSVHIYDDVPVTDSDYKSNFMLDKSLPTGANRAKASLSYAQELNPLVKVSSFETVNMDLDNIDLVCVTEPKWFCNVGESVGLFDDLIKKCREKSIKLYAGLVSGMFGFYYVDLGSSFEYSMEIPVKPIEDVVLTDSEPIQIDEESSPSKRRRRATEESHEESKTTMIKRTVSFRPMNEAMDLKKLAAEYKFECSSVKKVLRKYSQAFFVSQVLLQYFAKNQAYIETIEELTDICEVVQKKLNLPPEILSKSVLEFAVGNPFNPICAVVGGILAKEIIRSISQIGVPQNNAFFFDGLQSSGSVINLPACTFS